MTIRVFLIDDHALVRTGMRLILGTDTEIEVVGEAETGEAALPLVRQLLAEKPDAAPRAQDPNVRKLQDDLSERLGAAVQIDCNARGKGRLVISYNSLDELDGILAHIR